MRSRPANASVICVPIEAIDDERRRHQADEEDVHDEVAERHLAGEDALPPTRS
jgi:hypothetical protein